MQLEPLNFSKVYTDQIERNAISPGRKRSKNYNSSSILSGEFFKDFQPKRENDHPTRLRSNDVFILEKPATNSIKSISGSDSETSDLSSSEKIKKVVSWTKDLKEPANALNKYDDDLVPTKNRTHPGTIRKRSVSLSEIKTAKTLSSATFTEPVEQLAKSKSQKKEN